MAKAQTTSNPFYIVLVIVGFVFMLTACSYFVMTLQGREASYGRSLLPRDNSMPSPDSNVRSAAFTRFMDEHGFTLLMVELGLLAAATVAAMGTDEYWVRRSQPADNNGSGAPPDREELSDESEPSRGD